MNTADYLLEHGRDNDIAIIANNLEYTYADLRQASARLVAEMLTRGVGPSDRVGILGNNSLFWVAAYLATLKLGAVAVPFATTLTTDSVNAMQAFVNCRIMLAEKRIQRRFAAAFPAALPTIFDDVLQENGAAVWPAATDIDVQQDAALMFTSGTTGKAARRAHYASQHSSQYHVDCRVSRSQPGRSDDGRSAVLLLLRHLAAAYAPARGRLVSLVEQLCLS